MKSSTALYVLFRIFLSFFFPFLPLFHFLVDSLFVVSRDYKLQFYLTVSALTSTLSGCLTRKERFSLISADWTDFIQSLKFSVSRSSHSRLRWFVCFFFANLDSRYTSLFSASNSPPVYPFWRTWTIIINFVIIT